MADQPSASGDNQKNRYQTMKYAAFAGALSFTGATPLTIGSEDTVSGHNFVAHELLKLGERNLKRSIDFIGRFILR